MSELQIFSSPEFGAVRTIELNGEPWLVGRDVAEILGYTNPNEAIQDHVDAEDKFIRSARGREMLKLFSTVKGMQERLGRQDNWFINESGLYALVFGSKMPKAQEFKRWVTKEVLPSIRKHGAYMTKETVEQVLTSPDTIIKLAQQIKAEQEARAAAESQVLALTETAAKQEQLIGELKPKADYTDRILQNKGLVTITQIAKDYGMSGQAMNEKLHEMKIIYKLGKQWLLYAKYHGKGYTHSETVDFTHKDGTPDVTMNTKWTQKGRLFLYNELKKVGILPTIERDEEPAA